MQAWSPYIGKATVEKVMQGIKNGNTLDHYAQKLSVKKCFLRRKMIEIVGRKKFYEVVTENNDV